MLKVATLLFHTSLLTSQSDTTILFAVFRSFSAQILVSQPQGWDEKGIPYRHPVAQIGSCPATVIPILLRRIKVLSMNVTVPTQSEWEDERIGKVRRPAKVLFLHNLRGRIRDRQQHESVLLALSFFFEG